MKNSFRYRSKSILKVLKELDTVIEKCKRLEKRGVDTELRILYLDPTWELRLDIRNDESNKERIFTSNIGTNEDL